MHTEIMTYKDWIPLKRFISVTILGNARHCSSRVYVDRISKYRVYNK